MARETRPWFPYYPADFEMSRHVRRMGYFEQGVYMALLRLSWMHPGLPQDLEEMSELLQMDRAELERIWEGPLGRCFTPREDGLLYSERLEEERAKADGVASKRSEAGKKGAESRWHGKRMASASDRNAAAMAKDGQSQSQSQSDTQAHRQSENTQSAPPVRNARAREAPDPAPQASPSAKPLTRPGVRVSPPDDPGRPEPQADAKVQQKPAQAARRKAPKKAPWEEALAMDPLASLPELSRIWTEYHRYRVELRIKPWTKSTCGVNLNKYTPAQIGAAMQEAIEKGWQGPQFENWRHDGTRIEAARGRPEKVDHLAKYLDPEPTTLDVNGKAVR